MFLSWLRGRGSSPPALTASHKAEKSHKRSESESSTASTPKAKPVISAVPIPAFSLHQHDESDDEDDLPPPQFPAINSAQRASAASSNGSYKSSTGLMLPPQLPSSMLPKRGPPGASNGGLMLPPSISLAGGLRVPSTGPLPNRLPVSQSSSLMPHVTAAPNPKSKKVILAPGHSPLDWANLQRTNSNLAGVPKLLRVTPSLLKHYNGRKGKPAWSSYQGKVYNISPYIPFHPGGEGELRRAAGKDGEKLFLEVHPWVNWDNMLSQCLVGILVSENDPKADSVHEMEAMD